MKPHFAVIEWNVFPSIAIEDTILLTKEYKNLLLLPLVHTPDHVIACWNEGEYTEMELTNIYNKQNQDD